MSFSFAARGRKENLPKGRLSFLSSFRKEGRKALKGGRKAFLCHFHLQLVNCVISQKCSILFNQPTYSTLMPEAMHEYETSKTCQEIFWGTAPTISILAKKTGSVLAL